MAGEPSEAGCKPLHSTFDYKLSFQAQKLSGIGHTWEGLLHPSLKIQGKFYSRLGKRNVRLKSVDASESMLDLLLNWA